MGHPLPPELQALRPDLHLVYADLRNLPMTLRAVQEARAGAIIHLAAVGVTDPYLPIEQALRHNLTGSINLARAVFEHGASDKRLIVARTPGEVSPSNAYQASKAAAWSFCQMFANQQRWPIYGATIFQAYGPGQPSRTFIPSAFASASKGSDFAMSSGQQTKDWIYVQDVVEGLVALSLASAAPGQSVDLGSGENQSLLQVAKQIYALVGGDGQPLPGRLQDRPGEADLAPANIETTKRLTGWQSRTTLKEGLEKVWRHLRQSATHLQ